MKRNYHLPLNCIKLYLQ